MITAPARIGAVTSPINTFVRVNSSTPTPPGTWDALDTVCAIMTIPTQTKGFTAKELGNNAHNASPAKSQSAADARYAI